MFEDITWGVNYEEPGYGMPEDGFDNREAAEAEYEKFVAENPGIYCELVHAATPDDEFEVVRCTDDE